jgi:hypothetical protein
MKSLSSISLITLLACFLLPIKDVCAQQQIKNYQFVYIDHEVNTPVNQLCKKLKELYDDAYETGDVLIIYLSTGLPSEGNCMLSLTNLKDATEKKQDTEEAFDKIIGALQNSNYHSVNPKADVYNILKLFDTYNYQNDNGMLTYKNVKLSFYVGSRFWTLGYEYSILSYLYALLDVANMPQSSFSFNIMTSLADMPKFEKGKPFGELNLQNINDRITISLY